MNYLRYCIIGIAMTMLSLSLSAQEQPAGKVHGYVFGDYFYKFGGDSTGSGSQYSSLKKDEQAFQFRRLYLYYDHTISEKFAAQFLLEGNDKAFTDGKHGVYVKTAFVEWKDILPAGNLQMGLIPTPTWIAVSEKIWNFRPVEKTLADFRGLGLATDLGMSLRGTFSRESSFGYHLMIGNGNGQKPESNKYKKYYAALTVRPKKRLIIDASIDYEPKGDMIETTTFKIFASYQDSSLTLGMEAVQQHQLRGTGLSDRRPLGFSLFGWVPLISDLRGFARYDFFNNDANESSSGINEQFFTVGLDYMPVPNAHFMPNIWVNTYSDKGFVSLGREADIVGRMTFFFVYK